MADALTAPLLVAAAVLAVAGVAKLRAPAGAAQALRDLGWPVPPIAVRGFALGEVGLAGWTLAGPSRAAGAALAGLYALFAAITLILARRRVACGCFGDGGSGTPASIGQSLISVSLSAVALLGAIGGVHGVGWLLDRSVITAAVLTLGSAGAAYGTVVAYLQISPAWGAWSGR